MQDVVKRRPSKTSVFTLIAACGFFVPSADAKPYAPLQVTVSGADFRPLPIAVPDVAVPSPSPRATSEARAITELLRTDVELTRTFELVPVQTYLSSGASAAQKISFGAWSAAGASGVISGDVALQGNQVVSRLQFDDVSAQKTLLSRTCVSAASAHARCVHQFLDAVVLKLTHEEGIFSSRIAFSRRVGKAKAIYGADIDGGGLEKMVASGTFSLLPAWGALGRTLYFTSYIAGGTHLYALNTPTGRTDTISARPGLNVGAAASPDGKHLALTLTIDNNSEIYVMDVDGKNLTRLTDNPALDVSPTWSPDSRRIAFVSNRSGNPHIYVMDANGKNVRRLTYRGSYNQEPSWSPKADGQIAFTARDEALHYDLFLVHPDTAEMVRLTQDAANNMSPTFSPDGQHLAFVSDRDARNRGQIFVMDIDGRNVRAIMPGITDCETPAWGPRLGY